MAHSAGDGLSLETVACAMGEAELLIQAVSVRIMEEVAGGIRPTTPQNCVKQRANHSNRNENTS